MIALDLRGAAGDEQARIGPRAARPADRLAGLPHRLCGHGAAVDDHQVLLGSQQGADAFAFGDVEPAAERNNFRPKTIRAHAYSPQSKLPRKLSVAGPVMMI